MVQTALDDSAAAAAIEATLRDELRLADAAMANTRPILRHLLRNDDNSIFGDDVIARVRGLLHDVARQLVVAMGEAAEEKEPQAWAHAASGELAAAFLDSPVMVTHAHALAVEWQLTERLQSRLALDPVLSPLVQATISSNDPSLSAMGMALLAAQARFTQHARRMELPLGELPRDLFHHALLTMRVHAGEDAAAQAHAELAEQALRQHYQERKSRIGLIERLITALRGEAEQALSIDSAGVAIFLTALAMGSGQDRDMATLCTAESQVARLALSLCACGLKPEMVAAQFVAVHPDVNLPEGIAALRPDRAAAVLSLAAQGPGR